MKFQINQKVIALNNPFNELSQHRVKGNIYTVTKLSWCIHCGISLINIDNQPNTCETSKCNCGCIQPTGGSAWTMASEFASLTEESMEAFAETEEYELAAIVRNNLKLQNH
jgi:hypothetical protein